MKRCSTSTAIRETRIKTLVRCPFIHVGLAVIKRRASQAALEAKNLLAMRETQETQFHPWVRKIPWRRKWQPSPVFLPGESKGQKSLADYSPCGCKESDTIEHTDTQTHTH